MTALDAVAAVLMLVGAGSCLLGAVGLVRLPDLPARLQAATKPQTPASTALSLPWPLSS